MSFDCQLFVERVVKRDHHSASSNVLHSDAIQRSPLSVTTSSGPSDTIMWPANLKVGGQVVNSARFHSRIVVFTDVLSVAGERPESFYSTYRSTFSQRRMCSEILGTGRAPGRHAGPLDLEAPRDLIYTLSNLFVPSLASSGPRW
jgi:hypothetical protein